MIPKTIRTIILDALADAPKSLTQLEVVLAEHDYEPASANWAVWLLCRSGRILQLQRACIGTPSQYALGNPPPVAVRPLRLVDIAAALGITPQTLNRGRRLGYATLDPPTYTPARRGRPPRLAGVAAELGITSRELARGLRRGYATLDPPTYVPQPQGRASPDPNSLRARLRRESYEAKKEQSRIAAEQ